MKVLVTGGTGYVASRLVPELIATGATVRVTSRHPQAMAERHPEVETIASDMFDPPSLTAVLEDIDVAYYLVHSMEGDDFESQDRKAAGNFLSATEAAGVKRIVYLGGLGRAERKLSKHLKSRQEIGALLAGGNVSVVELRCAIVIGSGSIAFDMLRYLTERLPMMIAPRWLSTRIQPISEEDLVRYLIAAATEGDAGVVEIGGSDVLTYKDMILGYAKHRGLRRYIIGVPVLTPKLSSYWIKFVTPVPVSIARPLIDGLRNEVIVTNDSAQQQFPAIQPTGYDEAVRAALANQVEDLRTSVLSGAPTAPGALVGVLSDKRSMEVAAPVDAAALRIHSLGGDPSWYPLRWAWWVRARLDSMVGGIGLKWHRPDGGITEGSSVDWWTVAGLNDRAVLLRAEMKTPGEAWLSFRVNEKGDESELRQASYFRPKGIAGRLYWWLLLPFHAPIFGLMASRLAARMARNP